MHKSLSEIKNSYIIRDTLRTLMSREDVSEAKLSKATGINQTTLNRLLREGGDAKTKTLIPIAKFFGVSVSHLTGEFGENTLLPLKNSKVFIVPIIPFEQIISWDFHYKETTVYSYPTVVTAKNISDRTFATMSQNSMEPMFKAGTILIVDPDAEIKDGSYVLLSTGFSTPALRRIIIDGQRKYKASVFKKNEDPEPISDQDKIVGILIESRYDL